ncbi:MAG: UDP-N-acetylmuramoyl-tripeptide--D-alanyl-D-alanine ligase [Bacteroidales bacterium]|nr:UDP-N-acetylmuramoyl-tripeptide--D-alanyl-D-alanine ligase [Bacteroidales bacterium]
MNVIEKIYQHYTKRHLVSTDSRSIEKDCVFVAIKGERFDGNDFAYKVASDGIAACVIADRKDLPHHERLFIVDDSISALQQLAKLHRERINIPVIGITGTNGKTTTKELTAAVLSKRYNIIYTQGNYNNHIGVPLTLLQMRPDTEMAVVEMGANHINEIAQLCSIAQPDFGLITNIGKAHIEGFGSFEGVVKTKNELYEHLRNNDGKIFVNNDNTLLRELSKELTCFSYGKDNNADIKAEVVSFNPYLTIRWNDNEIKTNLIGEYNFENVLAAISIGTYFNVDKTQIIKAIEDYYPTNNRSQYIKTDKNEIVMDAYNANPVSMSNAIRNFRRISSNNALLILGDMKELGKDSENEHSIIISLVKELGFNKVFLVGEELLKADIDKSFCHFSNVEELISYINTHEVQNHKILVKGSNSIHLERLKNIL